MSKEIITTNGKTALVDDEDFLRLGQLSWSSYYASNSWYAYRQTRRSGKHKRIYLHREVMNAPKGSIVDHINWDGMDCRKINLRFCSQSQNQGNQKARDGRVRGATFHRASGKWASRISVSKRIIHLGLFETQQLAAYAYDVAARLHWGEFARPNFQVEHSDPEFVKGISLLMNSYVRKQAQSNGAVERP